MPFSAGGGGSSSIQGSTDVFLSGTSNGQVLSYDSGTAKWVNKTVSGGGGGSITAADLPAGSVMFARYNTTTSTWPARPTARTDIMVHWIGADESTPPPAAVNGVDLWDWNGS